MSTFSWCDVVLNSSLQVYPAGEGDCRDEVRGGTGGEPAVPPESGALGEGAAGAAGQPQC